MFRTLRSGILKMFHAPFSRKIGKMFHTRHLDQGKTKLFSTPHAVLIINVKYLMLEVAHMIITQAERMGQNRTSGQIWAALVSHIFLTPAQKRTGVHLPLGDHFYSHKTLRADSSVDFFLLTW